jgi:DNA-binding protein YbaB
MADSRASDSDPVDLALLAERARQMQHQLEKARDDLMRSEAQGFGGNGLVPAPVSGENVLVALATDPSVIDPDDPETLTELVREAVNEAQAKLAALRGEQVASVTGMLSGAVTREPRVMPLTPSRPRKQRKVRIRGRDLYVQHLAEVRRMGRQVAEDQRVMAAWAYPSPYRLWAIATDRRRVWERRRANLDFLKVCVGVGQALHAVEALLADREVCGALGAAGARAGAYFAELKRAEFFVRHSAVSAWEVDQYLIAF